MLSRSCLAGALFSRASTCKFTQLIDAIIRKFTGKAPEVVKGMFG